MPATSSLVSLDHAKDWAKRLAKAKPSISSLSQAQSAVALMLGHASWHALDRFYSPSPLSAPPPASEISGEVDPFQPLLDFFNANHPGLNATVVEVLAIETDEIDGGVDDILAKCRAFEDEGYFSQDAMAKALGDMCVCIHAPPGHSMIRVRDASEKATLLVISHADYKRVMPDPRQKT